MNHDQGQGANSERADGLSAQDVDDAFRSILEGLRTTLAGTQVLFGFLLILPMQPAFADLSGFSRITYYVAFIAAAIASVLLIAPSVHQRLRAPKTGVSRHSQHHLAITVGITNVGTLVFTVALAAAVFLVSDVVFTTTTATVATTVVMLTMAWTWFYVPLVTFARSD